MSSFLGPRFRYHPVIQPMHFGNYVRIEREARGGARNYVVHTADPRFAIEIEPDRGNAGQPGLGVIKRICIPNSCAGDYGKYAGLIGVALEFFGATEAPPPRR